MLQHSHFLFNGVVVDEAAARQWPTADELLEIDGLFETIKVVDGRPVFFAAHHARLSASCRSVGLPWSLPLETLAQRCQALLGVNGCTEGSLKVVVFPEPARGGFGELIFSRGPAYDDATYQRGFHLKTEIDPGRPVGPAHKSTKYRKNFLARERARASGCDDMLFATEAGALLEGAATTLFLVSGGQVLTPRLSVGILPGVVRGEILRHWKERVTEQTLSLEMLRAADEVFVTNALLGVMPVAAVDRQVYPMDRYTVTVQLREELGAWQAASLAS